MAMASSVAANGMSIANALQTVCNGSVSMQNGGGGVMPVLATTKPRGVLCCCALQTDGAAAVAECFGRRQALGMAALIAGGLAVAGPAFADFNEDYKSETEAVIERVKSTLALEKSDPGKADAVATLRQTSNDWVAKYRREKSVAGRPSFSNMYSVLNAISGHYISFGPNYPIPVKRKDRILEEIKDAEKALKRGR